MPSKNQQELLDYLGPEYSTKVIENELCLYRKLNAHYDIEISGTSRKRCPINIYVWDISAGEGPYAHTVESYFDITDWSTLKTILDNITTKYSGLA